MSVPSVNLVIRINIITVKAPAAILLVAQAILFASNVNALRTPHDAQQVSGHMIRMEDPPAYHPAHDAGRVAKREDPPAYHPAHDAGRIAKRGDRPSYHPVQ